MKKKLTLLAVVLLASLAQAASFTLTLTSAQVSSISYAYNAAPNKLDFASPQLWFANELNGMIAGYATRQAQESASNFCVKFNSLSVPNRDNVCTSLGLSAGCNCQ